MPVLENAFYQFIWKSDTGVFSLRACQDDHLLVENERLGVRYLYEEATYSYSISAWLVNEILT